MQCPRCNSKLDASLRFCPSCGLSVEELVQSLVQEQAELNEQGQEGNTQLQGEVADSDEPQLANSAVEDGDVNEVDDVNDPDADASEETPAIVGIDNDLSESEPDGYTNEPAGLADGAFPKESDGLSSAEPEPDPEPTAVAQRVDKSGANSNETVLSEEQESGSGFARFVRKHAVVLTALLIMRVGCAVALGIWLYRTNEAAAREQEQQQAYQESLVTKQIVPVTIQIDGYDQNSATPIPLKVAGTTKAGDAVDELVLIKPSSPQLELLPGNYKVALAGLPATADGALYRGSIDTYDVAVEASSASGQNEGTSSGQDVATVTPVFAFVQIAPQEVRDSDLDALRAWLEGAQIQNASQYVDAVVARRQEALDRIEQEQAQKEEQELKELEETTKKLEKEIADRNKNQDGAKGQTGNNPTGSSSSSSTYSNGGQNTYGSYDEYGDGYYDGYYYYY